LFLRGFHWTRFFGVNGRRGERGAIGRFLRPQYLVVTGQPLPIIIYSGTGLEYSIDVTLLGGQSEGNGAQSSDQNQDFFANFFHIQSVFVLGCQ
jgi:hypothetical protein